MPGQRLQAHSDMTQCTADGTSRECFMVEPVPAPLRCDQRGVRRRFYRRALALQCGFSASVYGIEALDEHAGGLFADMSTGMCKVNVSPYTATVYSASIHMPSAWAPA